ncbi:hypothetical protein BXZ70DRAFT_910859 [Cristinia sonorae]|uniref:Uncharacterized protein n=1 Tax=Cristinia sonorae TaxID=1940300 RepID=A0A8K0XKZ5_9AGAR|nr:hypothetical protein BXZ70DRAFT_910859 [Cristinia sonorae]
MLPLAIWNDLVDYHQSTKSPMPALRRSDVANLIDVGGQRHQVIGIAYGIEVILDGVSTLVNFCVMENSLKTAILGRPWQYDYSVGIGRNPTGTYVTVVDSTGQKILVATQRDNQYSGAAVADIEGSKVSLIATESSLTATEGSVLQAITDLAIDTESRPPSPEETEDNTWLNIDGHLWEALQSASAAVLPEPSSEALPSSVTLTEEDMQLLLDWENIELPPHVSEISHTFTGRQLRRLNQVISTAGSGRMYPVAFDNISIANPHLVEFVPHDGINPKSKMMIMKFSGSVNGELYSASAILDVYRTASSGPGPFGGLHRILQDWTKLEWSRQSPTRTPHFNRKPDITTNIDAWEFVQQTYDQAQQVRSDVEYLRNVAEPLVRDRWMDGWMDGWMDEWNRIGMMVEQEEQGEGYILRVTRHLQDWTSAKSLRTKKGYPDESTRRQGLMQHRVSMESGHHTNLTHEEPAYLTYYSVLPPGSNQVSIETRQRSARHTTGVHQAITICHPFIIRYA